MKYDVLALTFHEKVYERKAFEKVRRYALSKNILLMNGCEAKIEEKHVLLYNITDAERKRIKTFEDLRNMRKELEKKGRNILVVAAHPYFKIIGKTSLGKKLEENIDLFDAIEYHYFYTRLLNFNNKSVKLAKKYHKPLIGNCDVHFLENIGTTYTLINCSKNANNIINAIKSGKTILKTEPISTARLLWTALKHVVYG
jgi:predicted metal-dependent phosphoesterase TrpH